MTEPADALRWNVEQRLEFVEFRLFWEGYVNRSDLQEKFGISVPQASADLSRYQELAGQNLEYDKSRKAYVTTQAFKPLFYNSSARDYLTQLRLIADGVYTKEDTWCGWFPPFDVVPLVRRRAATGKLRKVLRAIRERLALYVRYQSVGREEPLWRWITPHALGFDGFRWHVRAWCHRNEDFRDFVLARMLEADKTKVHEINPAGDRGWHETVILLIGPHPDLEVGAKKAIELDYGMRNGLLEIKSRACLSWYLERHLGLDLDPSCVGPERQQIILLNRPEVQEARAKAKQPNEDRT